MKFDEGSCKRRRGESSGNQDATNAALSSRFEGRLDGRVFRVRIEDTTPKQPQIIRLRQVEKPMTTVTWSDRLRGWSTGAQQTGDLPKGQQRVPATNGQASSGNGQELLQQVQQLQERLAAMEEREQQRIQQEKATENVLLAIMRSVQSLEKALQDAQMRFQEQNERMERLVLQVAVQPTSPQAKTKATPKKTASSKRPASATPPGNIEPKRGQTDAIADSPRSL